MTLQIRPETPADHDVIRQVNEEAFGRPDEAWIIDRVRTSSSFIPALSLVAQLEDEIVGHILFSQGRVEGEAGAWELLALGPVAVRPSCQRQGIGSSLIRAGLERARELGYCAVFLIGHPTYYPRFGFTPARTLGLETRFPVSDEVFMVRPLWPRALNGIRGTVIYPPAFDEV